MLRVRPGVELVRAGFLPTSVLMTLDLPTFERPRKAISGNPGRGKCATSLADRRYCDKIRMTTVSSVWMAIGKSSANKLGLVSITGFCVNKTGPGEGRSS